jgi:DNA (cytosine-5)-methyltransferase 1
MSWLYSQVLVEEYLGDTSLDGEQSVPLNGNPIQQAYCAPDKMTDFSRLSRFGMTYKPLTADHGEELLTLYLAAFHAKTLAQQEKAQELTGNEAGCGEKWRASFTRYDPDSSLWRTHQCSLLGGLDEFLETWPQWGLMRDGECWEQQMLAQTIRGTEFGLSPNGVDSFHTPNTTGLDGGSNSRKALRKKMEKWPTPTVMDSITRSKESWEKAQFRPRQGKNLIKLGDIQYWPTPTAHMAKETNAPSKHNRNTPTLTAQVNWPTPRTKGMCGGSGSWDLLNKNTTKEEARQMGAGNGGKLNPMWVEWLMGWPLGWTDLKPLEMDKSLCVQQPLGES